MSGFVQALCRGVLPTSGVVAPTSSPDLEAHEAEFLPAALQSLQAQAVSPAGRWVARILMAMIAVLILWATLGKIDITVNASGKVIPSGYTKTIASVEIAMCGPGMLKRGRPLRPGTFW